MTHYVGIDVGKFTNYYYYQTIDGKVVSGSFSNDSEAIEAFISTLPSESHCILEATGVYHFPLVFSLQDKKVVFSLLNPMVSKSYADSLGNISKTDKQDSALLARYGRERQPDGSRLESKEWYEFRQLVQRWQDLQSKLQVIAQQEETLGFYPKVNNIVAQQIAFEKELLQTQFSELEQAIQDNLPPDYQEILKLATSIKGIGEKTALHLLFFTRALKDFQNVKQLAKYIGIAPTIHQSGRSQKKGRITKKGNHRLRSLLYNCTRSAIRFNTACKELYERLRAKGKAHKVAVVAVMHKLIKQFFAIVKSGIPYQDDFQTIKAKTT